MMNNESHNRRATPSGANSSPNSPQPQQSPQVSAGFGDAIRNCRKVLAHAWRSRVLWLLGLTGVAQLVLAAATALGTHWLTKNNLALVGSGQLAAAQTRVMVFYIILSLFWALSYFVMTALLAPMRHALLEAPGSARGFWWALGQALRRSPRLALCWFLIVLACAPAIALVAITTPLVGFLLVPPALVAVFLFAPVPWFVAAGRGIFASVKASVSLVRDNLLCFAAFHVVAVMLLLGCGCSASIVNLVPLIGESLDMGTMSLYWMLIWVLYVSVLATLEAAGRNTVLD